MFRFLLSDTSCLTYLTCFKANLSSFSEVLEHVPQNVSFWWLGYFYDLNKLFGASFSYNSVLFYAGMGAEVII